MNNVLIVIMLSVGGALGFVAGVEIAAVAVCMAVQWTNKKVVSRGQ